jgi:hypothetical protein
MSLRDRRFTSSPPLFEPLEPRLLLSSVSGHISVDTLWNDTSEPYVLTGDLYVDAGASLTLAPGITFEDGSDGPWVHVYGTLAADGVTFAGSHQSIFVRDGGVASIRNSTIPGASSWIDFRGGSAGTVDNVDGSAWTLHLRSAAASLINGSTVGNARAECAGES